MAKIPTIGGSKWVMDRPRRLLGAAVLLLGGCGEGETTSSSSAGGSGTVPPTGRDHLGAYAPAAEYVVLQRPGGDIVFQHGDSRLAFGVRLPLAGDFDGDGFDTVATYDLRKHELYVRNQNKGGPDDEVRVTGEGAVFPIAGDFDGDGVDTIGFYEPATATFDLDGSQFTFGEVGGFPVAGDFDGDGVDTVGVFFAAARELQVRNRNDSGPPDVVLDFGPPGNVPAYVFAADLDGDGSDSPGYMVLGTASFHWLTASTPGAPEETADVDGPEFGWIPISGRWADAEPAPPDPGYAWSTSEPQAQGLDPALLEDAYAFARSMPRIHSALVVRHGKLIAEEYMNGFDAASPQCIKSVSKSILSALYGIAAFDGTVVVEDPIAPYFPEHFPPGGDPLREKILIGHLLTMTGGMDWKENDPAFWPAFTQSDDLVGYILSQPMLEEPGTVFRYSTGLTHLAGRLLADASGMPLRTWAEEKLLSPIGVRVQRWDVDPDGYYFGGAEVFMSPRDLARFGQVYLDGGVADGQQIIAPEWVNGTTVPLIEDYGAWWWNRVSGGHDVYYAWGYGGQFVFNVKDLDLIVVVTHAWDVDGETSGAAADRAFELLDRIVDAAVSQ